MSKINIKWLLYHEPVELFIRTAEDFQRHLDQLTNNKYNIEILTVQDYQDKYLDGIICDPFTELKEGRVQVSQIYANSLGHFNASDFWALSMPFLFKNHEHATRVFEGEIGKKLFEHLYERTGVRGLAYTYSGGYKCCASTTPINTVEDFANKTFKRRPSPVFADMVKLLKANVVSNLWSHKKEESEIIETTYPRYHADATDKQKYVADTGHSMYLTTILLSDQFMSTLSQEDKRHFYESALRASRVEREQSIADAEKIKTSESKQEELGIAKVIPWNEQELTKLKNICEPLYKKYENFFSFDILDRIKKA
jgi:TRAP-type C4-dicarboxylate transport system substrate-binding protein